MDYETLRTDFDRVSNSYTVLKIANKENRQFHNVCMTLVKNKDEIEDRAAELISHYGYIKALKLAKEQAEQGENNDNT